MGGGDKPQCVLDDNCSICEVGGGGVFLPLFGDAEQEWPMGIRIVIYFVFMLWFFLGVGIVSDIFMEGIEVITSTEKVVKMKDGSSVTIKVWNATIANLTLMALGSSAPEILLNVIEILSKKFYAGALGPSTIVGSAAFNLMVIIGVCVSAPCPDTRLIADLHVFSTTAFFSVFAYIWLLIILVAWTPDYITLAEALITFILFPVLATIAFAADKNLFTSKVIPTAQHISVVNGHVMKPFSKDTYVKGDGKQLNMTPEEAQALLVNFKANHGVSRAQLKKQALAQVIGGKKHIVKNHKDDLDVVNGFANKKVEGSKTEFDFEAGIYHCIESDGLVEVFVKRDNADEEQKVDYKTISGTTTKDVDYQHTEGTAVFAKGSFRESIKVKIYDDDEVEDDEEFYIELSNPVPDTSCKIGTLGKCTVVIIDDDEPGQLGFRSEDIKITCLESSGEVNVMVSRMNGSKGEITCKCKTVEGEAKPIKDYVEQDISLTFAAGEVKKKVTIPIVDSRRYEKDETFKLVISDIKGPINDGVINYEGDDLECVITITADPKVKKLADSIEHLLEDDGNSEERTYKEQFEGVLYPEVEDGETPTRGDWIGHILTVPFKLCFATIPPPHWGGGKPCFCVALAWIGVVTAFIGDIAGLFGCCLGLKDSVTAITFVALGTSLPDTFASKAAALAEDTADSAVGNVTGSNSVNVFLGLGLPWFIATIAWAGGRTGDDLVYWQTKYADYPDLLKACPDGCFAVPAGALGFSVTVFTCVALMTIGTLVLRRARLGHELGGDPKIAKNTTFFLIFLWFMYVFLSILQAYEFIAA